MFVLLYADDTIVLAETQEDLQEAMHGMREYCNKFHLSINTSKTKVMVFSRGKIRNKPVIYFGDHILEVVFEYVYLGVTLSYNGSFNKAVKRLNDIATRAMFELIKKGRKLFLDTEVMLKLFDSTIAPIIMYGSEVWGYTNLTLVEKLHLKFCKILLNVCNSTTSVMVYGELGRLPLSIQIKCRLLNFWFKLVSTESESKLSFSLYRLMFNMQTNQIIECKWLSFVQNTLNNLGLSNIWILQGKGIKFNWFRNCIKQRLLDQGQQDWQNANFHSAKCLNYRIFKETICFENYLTELPTKLCKAFTRFRCRNNMLPIENGSRLNVPRNMRICLLCNSKEIGDEYHYLLVCTHFKDTRKTFFKEMRSY